ncbi:hypothetical protein SAMN05216262_13120 [Colwellia chukchiensis]|uniref:Uncharacterized protein n=1 Tax=Colwellia chukchiensis TaxID=641665 RepID=A0A1H7U1Z7_9GAMM|nr:hypothetical protein [Colwellia chukchiensis]SEL90277.1 hypothetical protein SAMN05216262_13120 [Colwellia chukchiensis]
MSIKKLSEQAIISLAIAKSSANQKVKFKEVMQFLEAADLRKYKKERGVARAIGCLYKKAKRQRNELVAQSILRTFVNKHGERAYK